MKTLRKTPLKTLAVAGLAFGLLSACSNVQLEPKADNVKMLSKQRTRNCDRVGRTNVSVQTKVGFIARSQDSINQDLHRLARNSAVDMNGDTVTAAGPVNEGKQSYFVYDCVQ